VVVADRVDIAGVEAVVHTVERVVGVDIVAGSVVVDIEEEGHMVGPEVADMTVQVCMVALAVDMVWAVVELTVVSLS